MYCPNCGKQTNGSPYCSSCGQPVAGAPSAKTYTESVARPHKTHKSRNTVLVLLGVFVVIVVLGIIGRVRGIIGSNSPNASSSSFSSTSASTPSVSVKSEEEAKAVVDRSHEDQVAAKSIHVTAVDLWSRYHENQVAANNAFLDKWLVVTGIVAVVGKQADDIYINLEGPSRFDWVRAVLADDQVKYAASLKIGDTVSLLCSGAGAGEISHSPKVDICSFYPPPAPADNNSDLKPAPAVPPVLSEQEKEFYRLRDNCQNGDDKACKTFMIEVSGLLNKPTLLTAESTCTYKGEGSMRTAEVVEHIVCNTPPW